ncbi:MAG: hypothetical protein ABH800_01410 [Candidatus Nealsonbacteria bacterium]
MKETYIWFLRCQKPKIIWKTILKTSNTLKVMSNEIKICLPIDKRASELGYAIALLLKEKYEVKNFYDLACPRRDEEFLKFQKDIQYSPLFVREELEEKVKDEKLDLDYLKFLEKEYGVPNIWPYIAVDRRFMTNFPKLAYSEGAPLCSHEEMLKHLQVKFREISKALEEIKPDAVIFITIGKVEEQIVYWLAKKMGIKIIHIRPTRVKNRVVLADTCYDIFSGVNKFFDSIRSGSHRSDCKEEAISFLKEFQEKPSQFTSYYLPPKKKVPFFEKIIKAGGYFWQLRKDPFGYFKKKITRSKRKWKGFKGLFEEPNENEEFAFYPLHLEPELATSLLAPFYMNQIALIQNIARSLPVHFKLYVKEHPNMVYKRSLSYYKELRKIPNVKLINPAVQSIPLIKKAKIVLTITGTAGWEAVLFGKPVITFGQVFYNKLSIVERCQSIEELPLMIKKALENFNFKEDELIDFLSAIFEDSVVLDYDHLLARDSLEEILVNEDFKKFVDFLAKDLGLAVATKEKKSD